MSAGAKIDHRTPRERCSVVYFCSALDSRALLADAANPNRFLESDLPLRKPGELDSGGGHGLLAGKVGGGAGGVDGSFPVFQGEVAVDLEVLANALDRLEVDVIQGGAAWDEVRGGFLIAQTDLEQFIAAQVIGNPGLAAFVLAPDPVAEELALVGVALFLDTFVVHEMAVLACTV